MPTPSRPGTSAERSNAAGSRGRARRAAARAVILLAASLALAASCVESPPAGPVFPLIPGDAIAAAVVSSPYKLFAAVEELWKAAGLSSTFGGSPSELLSKGVPNSDEALAELDFARPWAFALLPPEEGASKPRTVLYVPLRGASEAFLEGLGGGSMRLAAKAKGYAVLASGESDLPFPPAQPLDLSRLDRYPASSIKVWGDPKAIRLAAMDGFKPVADAARRFVTGEEPAADAAAEILREASLALLKEVKAADAAIVPGAAGLSIRVGAAARPSGPLAAALVKAASAPSALDWAAQADAGALYGYAWSGDPAVSADLYASAAKPFLLGLGIPEGAVAGIERLQRRWTSATGPRGAASFDMSMDVSAIAEIEKKDPATVAEAMKRLLSIRVEALQEVKDEAAYRALLRGIADDPDLAAFWKAYEEKLGVGLGLVNKDLKDGAFSYGELRLALRASDPERLGLGGEGAEEAAAIFDALGDLMSYRWAVADGRMSLTSGDAAALKALASRKAAPRPLSADPGFAAFAKTLPPKPIAVGYFSLGRAIGLVSGIASAGDAPEALKSLALQGGAFGSWYSYAAVGGTAGAPYIETGMLVPAKDIGGLVGLVSKLAAARKDGGQ